MDPVFTVTGAAGLTTTGLAGGIESCVIVGTTADPDELPAASVAVTRKSFGAFEISGTAML